MLLLLLSVLIATVSAAADVRLTSYPRGRLEVNFGNGWHEVCGHWFWNSHEGARSSCIKMGYPAGGRFHRSGHKLVNPVYIGQCHRDQLPGDCTAGCCTGGVGCRNTINCGDCTTGSTASVVIECIGERTKPPTPAPTTSAPTPAPTTSPTEEASYGNIIEWLRQLIAEGNAEIERIEKKTVALKDNLKSAETALNKAENAEGVAEANADTAATALSKAQGAWKTCLATFNNELKRLNEEIAIFTKVKSILSGLINGKQLLEEEKADVNALISQEDQADPVKVRAIIALVQNLIDSAKAEITRITTDKNQCADRLKEAERVHSEALGVLKAAQKAVQDAEDDVERAKGALSAQIEYATKRIGIVNDEIDQFEDIIELLTPLFE